MFEGVKMATGPREVLVPWDDEFVVRVRFVSRREKMSLSADLETGKTARKKAGSGFNALVFSDNLCSAGLVGWEGLKHKHLLEIIENVADVEDASAEIPYSPEAKAEIIQNMTDEFSAFVMRAIDQAGKIRDEQLKN